MNNLFVIAELHAAPGKEAAMEAELKKVIPTVRAEEGCIRYNLLKSEKGTKFLFQETWTGKDALEAHLEAPHMVTMFEAIQKLLAGPPSVTEWYGVDMA